MSFLIFTSAGQLLLLQSLQIWTLVLLLLPIQQQQNKFADSFQSVCAVLSFGLGLIVFFRTPTSFYTSFGLSYCLSFAILFIIVGNQILFSIKKHIILQNLNFIYVLPVLFLLGLSQTSGMQVTPNISFLKVIGFSILPVLILQGLALFGLINKRVHTISTLSFKIMASILLTALIYFLMEAGTKQRSRII